MDIEFHYHITYILARKGGYNTTDASTIAYACQYTDDNNEKYEVKLDGGTVYENFISQTLNILRPKNKLVRIYSCFHFFPGDYAGDEAKRSDGSLHLFNTTPDSSDAAEMFKTALDKGDLYRTGIATHCYSDTWAHQNFVGFKHAFGGMDGLLEKATPNIGHADAQHQPDIPNLEWTDPRLTAANSTISNRKRFLLAARSIFTMFAQRNGLVDIEPLWAELAERLARAIGDDCSDIKQCNRERSARITAYGELCPDMPAYEEQAWQIDAMQPVSSWWQRIGDKLWRTVGLCPKVGSIAKAYWPKWFRIRTFRAKDGFGESHWFKFQQAIKQHQEYVMDLQDNRYQQIDAALKDAL